MEQEKTETTEKKSRPCLLLFLGLIINFNELKLTDGVSRLILPGANLE
jgi:hypothetical protein